MEPIRFRRGSIPRYFPMKSANGFTLIELLVVLIIIGILAAVVIVNQKSFNQTIVLKNTAYDIALTLRTAETFGLGGRVGTNLPNPSYNVGYGVHFQSDKLDTFTLFVDSYPASPSSNGACHSVVDPDVPQVSQPGNCVYEPIFNIKQSEKITTYTLGNGITIKDFCASYWGSDWSCVSNGLLTSLDIVFAGSSNPFMALNGIPPVGMNPVQKACVTVTSPQGGEQYLSVSLSGQIIGNATSCPG